MRSLYPLSDKTVEELKACVTPCHFPKRHLLVRENIFCKYAYFIEKGITRSYWLVDGQEITTSFAGEGTEFSDCFQICHILKIFIIPCFDLLDFVRCTESVEEVDERTDSIGV